jgi:glycerophosphoryl diester phosphodiesterase
VLSLLEGRGDTGRVLIGSFLQAALEPFRRAGLPTGSSVEALKPLYVPALFGARPASLPFDAMIIPPRHGWLPLPIAQFTRMVHARGGAAHVWTVNDPAQARALWAKGVNGLLSDDPATLLAARGGAA